jgi:chromosome segregation ATPase
MNENTSENLRDKRSFEERVLARFDAFDARFDSIDARLEKLEARNLDTKPIWERALKAIMDTGPEVGEIKNRIDSLEKRAETIQVRLGTVESDLGAMRNDYAALHDQLIKTQGDFKKRMLRRIDSVLEIIVDTHGNMRDYEERLNRLESKLA